MTLLHNKIIQKFPAQYYQQEAFDKTVEEWLNYNRVLVVLPTGAGKTFLAGMLIAKFVREGKRCLMLAHTRKLVEQFAQATETNFNIWSSCEMGSTQAEESPLVCSTVQTAANRLRKGAMDASEFDLIIWDESHRALSDTHQEIAAAFPHAKHIGITATPRRGDQKDLMKFFEVKAADVPLNELIEKGYLAPLTIKNIPVKIELKASKKSGDYTEADCAHAIEPYLDSIADHYVSEARGRCGLVFAPLIATSRRFTEILCDKGVRAEHVDGEMGSDAVNAAVKRLEMGEIECLSNSMILSEGVDIRPVNVILSLRPTRSWTLYVQQVGRGTRTFHPIKNGPKGTEWPEKDGCLILDPLWLCDQHSLLQRPSVLFAADDEEAEAIDQIIKKKAAKGGGGDGEVDILEARNEARAEREQRLADKLAALANRKARLVNALDLAVHLHIPELESYEPLNSQEARDISHLTAKQRQWMEKSKIQMDSIKNMGQAQLVLNALGNRAKEGRATISQVKYAMSLGMPEEQAWASSFEDASKYIEAHSPPKPKWMANWKKH